MKKRIVSLVGFSVLLLAIIALIAVNIPSTTPSNAAEEMTGKNSGSSSAVFSIHEINERAPKSGNFTTQGFVAKIYTAPPCPPGAECKTSMADNIVISQDNKGLDTYDLTNKEMVVFTEKAASFKQGVKHRFEITITDKKTTNEKLNDVTLRGYNSIK